MAGGMSRGAAIGNEKQLWPNVNGKRVIPYVINSGMMHVRWRFISVYIYIEVAQQTRSLVEHILIHILMFRTINFFRNRLF